MVTDRSGTILTQAIGFVQWNRLAAQVLVDQESFRDVGHPLTADGGLGHRAGGRSHEDATPSTNRAFAAAPVFAMMAEALAAKSIWFFLKRSRAALFSNTISSL